MAKQKKKKKNYGKMFEQDFMESATKQNLLFEREKDNIAFQSRGKNPYDFRVYDYPNIFFLELKSTGNASVSLQENIIRPHQIEELYKRSKIKGVHAGFLFEFRERNLKTKTRKHEVYYLDIQDFAKKPKGIKSLSVETVKSLGGVKVEAEKKISRYTIDVKDLIMTLKEKKKK